MIADKDGAGVSFDVHKEFACHYSPVLKAAFNSKFVEGQTQAYAFPEYEPEVIRCFIEWIYSQQVSGAYSATDDRHIQFSEATLVLSKLWVLADSILVPKLQNYVIHELKRVCDSFQRIPTNSLEYIYLMTNSESPLRRWCFQWCVRRTPSNRYVKFPHLYPK